MRIRIFGWQAFVAIAVIFAFLIALFIIAVNIFLFLLPIILIIAVAYFVFSRLFRKKNYFDVKYRVKR